jgi:parallel beta-helix repeat protein
VICGAAARTNWHVATTGSDITGSGTLTSPLSSIQTAINAATVGDTVSVAIGNYVENINFNGKNIVVIGEDRETTIIDGNQAGSVVTFDSGEDSTAVLSGFTIKDGSADYGGGMFLSGTNPTITNVTISGNTSTNYGGGMFLNYSDPTLTNVTISGNTANNNGGGMHLEQESNPTLTNVTISGNTANIYGGGGIYSNSSSTNITNCEIIGNNASVDGGGLLIVGNSEIFLTKTVLESNTASGGAAFGIENSNVNIDRATVLFNEASIHGGGLYLWNNGQVNVTQSIIAENTPQQIFSDAQFNPNTVSIQYANIDGGQDSIITNDNSTVTCCIRF